MVPGSWGKEGRYETIAWMRWVIDGQVVFTSMHYGSYIDIPKLSWENETKHEINNILSAIYI